MTKIISTEVIEKIYQILLLNLNKINLLRNDLSNINDYNNNKIKTNQFLKGIEIDIKNILSLLERLKIDFNYKNNPNEICKTYCLNNDKNMLQDIVVCGCCECCKCQKCCDCSTNNCSDNQQLNISNNNIKNNINNEYIKERINSEEEDDKNNEFKNINIFNKNNLPNNSFQPSSLKDNNNTYPNLYFSDNFKNEHKNYMNNNNYNDNNKYNDNNDYNSINNNYKYNKNNNNYNDNNYKYGNNNGNDNNYENLNNNKNNYNDYNYNSLKPINEQNLNNNNYQGNSQQSNYSNNNNYLNNFQRPFGFIKRRQFNNMDIDDNKLPIEEKIKNSAIMKSKRFHGSKSFDNIERPYQNKNRAKIINFKNNKDNNYRNISKDNNYKFNNLFGENLNEPKYFETLNINNIKDNNNYSDKKNRRNINLDNNNNKNNSFENNNENNNILNNKGIIKKKNSLTQKKKKMENMNKIQRFINKLYKQPKDINNRFKKIYGDDIEEKLLNGDIDNDNLNEMENILDKIIKMSIWGEDDQNKTKKRDISNSYDKKNKKKHFFVYNPIQEKIKLMKSIKNNQAYFKEYPRGWYSTKEYFINNGTEINNENINKYV